MTQASILIVEDETIVALDLKKCLEDIGYRVSGVVHSGEEAIVAARADRPDLILMDIKLEGEVNGIQAAAAIRQENHHMPVCFVTAHADQATLDEAKITEPYGYILKPFRELEVRTVIELALHRAKADSARIEKDEAENAEHVPDFTSSIREDQQSSSSDQVAILRFLKTVEPFRQLSEPILRSLCAVCRYGLYAAGDHIIMEGEKVSQGFLVVYGRVALVKSSTNGKELIVELLGTGDPFSLLPVLQAGSYQFTARPQVDTRILWVPEPVVSYLLTRFPDLTREFISKVLERLRKAHDLSRSLAHDQVDVRIASALLALVPRFCSLDKADDAYKIRLTRQELAEMTGTAPETVSRVVKNLEREGLLDLSEAGKVRIINLEGLQHISESQ